MFRIILLSVLLPTKSTPPRINFVIYVFRDFYVPLFVDDSSLGLFALRVCGWLEGMVLKPFLFRLLRFRAKRRFCWADRIRPVRFAVVTVNFYLRLPLFYRPFIIYSRALMGCLREILEFEGGPLQIHFILRRTREAKKFKSEENSTSKKIQAWRKSNLEENSTSKKIQSWLKILSWRKFTPREKFKLEEEKSNKRCLKKTGVMLSHKTSDQIQSARNQHVQQRTKEIYGYN